MGLNFNINLPGPFSYSARVTPNIGKTVRQINRAAKMVAEQQQAAQVPGPPCARPQDRTITDGGTSGGTFALWLLGLTLVILAILGFGGFRL